MTPVMLPNGKVGAQLHAQARQEGRRACRSTRRSSSGRARRSGLKYVELDTGPLEEGLRRRRARCRPRRPRCPVELDEVYNMFDAPTRRAVAGQPAGLRRRARRPRRRPQPDHPGRAAALRPPRLGHGQPVRRRAPSCPRFFKELGDAARIVAPVSKTNAHLFTTMANTFDAISRDPQALKSTISKSPPTLRRRHRSRCSVQRPFLEHTAALSRDLDTATTELRGALPTVNSALRVGTPVQRRSVDAQRQPAGRARRARGPRQGADHDRLAARPDGHRRARCSPSCATSART